MFKYFFARLSVGGAGASVYMYTFACGCEIERDRTPVVRVGVFVIQQERTHVVCRLCKCRRSRQKAKDSIKGKELYELIN